jgi:hypothetical protein
VRKIFGECRTDTKTKLLIGKLLLVPQGESNDWKTDQSTTRQVQLPGVQYRSTVLYIAIAILQFLQIYQKTQNRYTVQVLVPVFCINIFRQADYTRNTAHHFYFNSRCRKQFGITGTCRLARGLEDFSNYQLQ